MRSIRQMKWRTIIRANPRKSVAKINEILDNLCKSVDKNMSTTINNSTVRLSSSITMGRGLLALNSRRGQSLAGCEETENCRERQIQTMK